MSSGWSCGKEWSLTLIGSAIGVVLAAALSRVLAGFLFGIPPIDPITFAGTTVLFAAIGLAACYVPVLSRDAHRSNPGAQVRVNGFIFREDFGFGLKPAFSMRSAWDRFRAMFSMMS